MKYEMTVGAQRELNALPREHRQIISSCVAEFSAFCDHYAANGSWPSNKFRVKQLSSYEGVWEMTWNFKQPDLRATFEWISLGDPPAMAVLWRRVGYHGIFGAA